MQKLDWSKLSEMQPYEPTGPGRYVMRCGGVVTIEWNNDRKYFVTKCGREWFKDGKYATGQCAFDIVAPAPDVLPWETLISEEEANIELRSENEELMEAVDNLRSDYKSLLEACEADRQARLNLVEECERLKGERNNLRESWAWQKSQNSKLPHDYDLLKQQRDQYESELRAAEELNRKWRSDFDSMRDDYKQQIKQLEAERDEWKQAANTLASDIKRLSVRAEMPQDAEIKEGRWQSVERELCDLQQRVAKLEQFHEAIVKPGTGFTVVTLPQAIEPLPAVTEEVQADKEVAQ